LHAPVEAQNGRGRSRIPLASRHNPGSGRERGAAAASNARRSWRITQSQPQLSRRCWWFGGWRPAGWLGSESETQITQSVGAAAAPAG